MDASAEWKTGLSFTGKASSGFELPMGVSLEAGGANDGFRPMELMLVSLAGCTAMDVISILQKKQQRVTAFEVKVHADRAADYPQVFTRATITYRVTGKGVEEKALLRSVELSSTKYCSAQAMLEKAMPLELNYQIFEDEGKKPRLICEGNYPPSKA